MNWRWHGENFVSVAQMFDPLANASYAAGFLKDLEAESGDWSVAAGAYHSRTPDEAARYRTAFDANRAGLGDRPLAEAPPDAFASADDAPPRENAYRLLQRRGTGGRMGSLVPLGG